MITTPRKFYGYLKKDFLLLYNRKKYLYTFFLLPIVISLLFLLVLNPVNYQIKAGICNLDSNKLSDSLFEEMENFESTSYPLENCENNLKEDIKSGKISLGIVIPSDFSQGLESLKRVSIVAYYDMTDVSLAGLLSWKVDNSMQSFEKQIIDELNNKFTSNVREVREGLTLVSDNLPKTLSRRLDSTEDDLRMIEEMETDFLLNPINTHHKSVYESDFNKAAGLVFVFPLIAIFITLMLSSTSIIYDKNTKFLTRVKSSTSPGVYLFAKLIFFVVLVILQFLIIIGLFIAYGARYSITFLPLLELVVSIAIIDTLLGFLIGLISENEGIAVLFSLIISFPLMLTSGIFFPTQTLPRIIQWIAKIMPLNFQIQASKSILLFNQGLTHQWIIPAGLLFCLTWYLIKRR